MSRIEASRMVAWLIALIALELVFIVAFFFILVT